MYLLFTLTFVAVYCVGSQAALPIMSPKIIDLFDCILINECMVISKEGSVESLILLMPLLFCLDAFSNQRTVNIVVAIVRINHKDTMLALVSPANHKINDFPLGFS